jgi:hypothetical protein
MAYTVQQLITFSYYLSNLLARGLEEVSAQQITDGLDRFNGMLATATSQIGLIPYFQEYDFPAVINQEVYYVPSLVEVETMTFNINNVRYSMMETSREKYFATPRVDNIDALPYMWHFERLLNGGNIYLYFLPQQAYVMKLWGKFKLNQATLETDLTLVYEDFYIEYLKYKLAKALCDFNGAMFPPQHQVQLESYEKTIRNVIPLDLTMKKISSFSGAQPFNYADANIGRGFRPS